MGNNLPEDVRYCLYILLLQTRHLIYRNRDRELSKYGITGVQASLLLFASALDGNATPAELSRCMIREPQSISGLLSRMEKEGLIIKARNPDKKGRLKVVLTKKGRQVYSQACKRESITEIMSCLSEEECRQLWSSLEKLRDKALENLKSVRKMPFP